MIASLQIVAQQRGRLVEIHNENVEITVVVEVSKRAAANRVRSQDSRPRLIA